MKLTIIVAFAENQVIGKDNQLIWHLPNDLKRFKLLTTGKPIIMGRKTFESIGKPLPNRENIVLTRDKNWKHEGAKVFHSKEAILEYLENHEHAYVIGGAEIYKLFLDNTDFLEITYVDTNIDGDAFFPLINYEKWNLISEFSHEKDEKHAFSYKFVTYRRKTN
ncbi:dihydrofolate reductase [Flavobacteriaceae bacterium UJ101]|nr:dihydrofolate reductase [Flavobacteriaceae bacterium UJ101]